MLVPRAAFSASGWGPIVNISTSPNNCSVACHGTQHNSSAEGDTVHVVFAENQGTDYYTGGDVVYRRSLDFGDTWEAKKVIFHVDDPAPDTVNKGPGHVSLASWNRFVYIAFEIDSQLMWHDPSGSDSDTMDTSYYYWIYFSRSTDGGVNWSSPVLLAEGEDIAGVAVAASGPNVYVVWAQGNGVYLRASNDYGASFGGTRTVWSSWFGAAMWPDVAASGSTVHVLFTYFQFLTQGVMYARSTDGGSSWSTTSLSSGAGVYDYPSIAVARDAPNNVYAVWGVGMWLEYARSSDGGASWSSIDTLVDMRGSGYAKAPSVATSPNGQYVHVFWNRVTVETGMFDWEVFYTYSNNYGVSWLPPTPTTDWNASEHTNWWSILPSTAANDTCACVTWSDSDFFISNAEMYYRRICNPDVLYQSAAEAGRPGFRLVAAPHRGRLEVRLELPGPALGKLSLYDVAGRAVQVLRAGRFGGGSQRLVLPTEGLRSGIYRLVFNSNLGTLSVPVALY